MFQLPWLSVNEKFGSNLLALHVPQLLILLEECVLLKAFIHLFFVAL